MPCGAIQDGRILVERSDRTWSTGEGNGKPLEYSCLENPMNSMKRQKDRTLKDELPRSVGAQYATGDQWRNNSRKNEDMEPKQKLYKGNSQNTASFRVQVYFINFHVHNWHRICISWWYMTFSYCSQGSQGKNTEVVCHSLLQWTIFCQTSSPWPIRLGWPHMTWLSFIELDKAVVLVIRLASFLWFWFQCVCPLMPLATPTVLLGFLLPWTWGISSWLLQQSVATAPYLGHGVSSVSCSLLQHRPN